MLSIDEAIARERNLAEIYRNDTVPKEDYHNMPWIDMENELNMRRAEEHEQLADWLEELKEMQKNQGQIADFWYQEGISRESKLIFDKIEEIKNRYNVEDFAIIGVLIKVQEIALEIAEELNGNKMSKGVTEK